VSRALVWLGALLFLTACGSGVTARGSASVVTSASRVAAEAAGRLPGGSRLLRLIATNPSAGYAAGGSLYLTQTSPVGEHVGEDYKVSRVDARTGRILASRRFAGELDGLLLADGSLWATTGITSVSLWRLDPRSLVVRSRTGVPTSRLDRGIVGSLVAAGGELWVGAGELDQLSLPSGRLKRVVALPYRGPVQLAADPMGRFLVASVGFGHPVHIVRLNARSGLVLSRRTLPRGVSPAMGGVVDGGVWMDNTVGTNAIVIRLGVNPLAPSRTSPLAKPASRASVRVLDGVLWVTEPLGQANLNYCADPLTGRPLVELPPLPGDSVFLAATASTIFYTDVPVNAHSVKLESAPVNPRCRP
jgi:hypothetical protein